VVKTRIVHGVGINDLDYQYCKTTYQEVNGKVKAVDMWKCPYYVAWGHMMDRAYAKRYSVETSSYFGVHTCEDWLYASKFVEWMNTQVWQGLELDKDILVQGNKIYSPETCSFVPKVINLLLIRSVQKDRDLPTGVCLRVYKGKKKTSIDYAVNCSSVFLPSGQVSGFFKTKEEAHRFWQVNKARAIEQAVEWWYTDPKYMYSYQENVADSLLARASRLKNEASMGVITRCI